MTRWTADDVPALDGEVVVVTGANSGLGFEGTRLFAEAGAAGGVGGRACLFSL